MCGNKNPGQYHRVIERKPAQSAALKTALDAVSAFVAAPAYQKRNTARREMTNA